MLEERTRIIGRNMCQRLPNRSLQCLVCSSADAPQLLLDFRERQLNWREIWRVGRHVPQPAASFSQQFSQAHVLMGTQIVQQNDLSWPQRRPQDVLDIRLEHRARHAALSHQARPHSCQGQRADRRGIGWRVAWQRGDCPFATWSTGVAPCQIEIGAELIDHDDISRLDVFLLDQKASSLPRVTFSGNQRLFLRVKPSARMARPIVHWLRDVP